MLTLLDAYKLMYKVFDTYYRRSENSEINEIIGSMLGFMSLEIWHDNEMMTADPAVWKDWIVIVSKITEHDMLTLEETRKATIDFLDFHYTQFGFPIKQVIDDLANRSTVDKIWLQDPT